MPFQSSLQCFHNFNIVDKYLFHSREEALLRAATRDSNDLAVDPATILRRQEADDASDVLGSGAAAERAVLGHHLLDGSGGDVGGATGDVWM